ncbi:MAG: GntR family transcriptional regulator [Phototrophicaceae bacterium]
MSLREQAYQKIRQMIVSLHLEPGATLDEGTLQRELQLGRTPVREALLRLSHEQLVNIAPRRGMFVAEISINDLRHLFEGRLVLEEKAIRLAVEYGTPQHWEQMEAVLFELQRANAPLTNEQLIHIDERCHHIIYQATGNRFLQDTLSTWYALSLRLWYFYIRELGDMHPTIHEHQLILEALRAKDEEVATRLMVAHIGEFQAQIHSAMLGMRKRL